MAARVRADSTDVPKRKGRRGSKLRLLESEREPVDPIDYEQRAAEIEEFAAQLTTNQLQCRELGHIWKPFNVSRLSGGAFLRTLRCSRCRTKREQELSSRGGVVHNHYDYSDAKNYQRKGMGRLVGSDRDTLRLASMFRGEIHEYQED